MTPRPDTPDAGRCGSFGPRMIGPGADAFPYPVCTLTACHPGWHRDTTTGTEWENTIAFNPVPAHCTDPAAHEAHRYADDTEHRVCPGTRPEDAEPSVCRSARCRRSGVNGAGFCCHGCARADRFGGDRLHGNRCEENNPGAKETADRWMGDRDRAQAALQAEVDRVFVPGCLANVTNTVDVLAPTVADLIQQTREEVTGGYTQRRTEQARQTEAAVWQRRMAEEKEAADAELAEQDQQLRDQAATIARLEAQARGLTAEVAVLQAADVDPDDTLLSGISGGPGETTVSLRPPEKLMRAFIASMIDMLGDATNYVEIDAANPAGEGRYTVRVERAGGKTPHELRMEAEERARTGREEGRQAGAAELVAHLADVAAGARAGRAGAYPEEAERMGPTRWCLVTERAHELAQWWADGRGLPVPDATARADALEKELERVQGRHATEVVNLRQEAADWKRCYEARERWAYQLQAELHEVRTTSRRRELVLVDRLRRRGDRLAALEANDHGREERRVAYLERMNTLGKRLRTQQSTRIRNLERRLIGWREAAVGATGVADRLVLIVGKATRFEVGPVTVTPHGEGEGWRCSWSDPDWPGAPGQGLVLTEDHPDRDQALNRAAHIAG